MIVSKLRILFIIMLPDSFLIFVRVRRCVRACLRSLCAYMRTSAITSLDCHVKNYRQLRKEIFLIILSIALIFVGLILLKVNFIYFHWLHIP